MQLDGASRLGATTYDVDIPSSALPSQTPFLPGAERGERFLRKGLSTQPVGNGCVVKLDEGKRGYVLLPKTLGFPRGPNAKRPRRGRGLSNAVSEPPSVVALSKQEQQGLEHVDKVEIERQSAEHTLLLRDFIAVALIIIVLDRLRVPCRQAGEDQH